MDQPMIDYPKIEYSRIGFLKGIKIIGKNKSGRKYILSIQENHAPLGFIYMLI